MQTDDKAKFNAHQCNIAPDKRPRCWQKTGEEAHLLASASPNLGAASRSCRPCMTSTGNLPARMLLTSALVAVWCHTACICPCTCTSWHSVLLAKQSVIRRVPTNDRMHPRLQSLSLQAACERAESVQTDCTSKRTQPSHIWMLMRSAASRTPHRLSREVTHMEAIVVLPNAAPPLPLHILLSQQVPSCAPCLVALRSLHARKADHRDNL